MTEPLLAVRDLKVEFRTGLETVHAVNGASLTVEPGEIVAVLGESGSGKSVTAAAIMRLLQTPPAVIAGGEIRFKGRDILALPPADCKPMLARDLALVLQDALTALNPVYPIGWQIAEVFRVHGDGDRRATMEKAVKLLERVGIPDARRRASDYPHQFSGGMRQRAMIAMAVALHPSLLIADEPTTALDLSVQAQVINLLEDIQARTGIAYLFIAHDLSVVRHMSNRVAVMYLGRMAEIGPGDVVFDTPAHPYSAALLSAEPVLKVDAERRQRIRLKGEIPSPANPPSGCRFRTRCWKAAAICTAEQPELRLQPPGAGRLAACHFPLDVAPLDASLQHSAT